MKALLIGLLAMGTFSAFASVNYECLYMDAVTDEESSVANSFKIKFNDSGLRINNLNISVEDERMKIQHVVENKIINEITEELGVRDFRFVSEHRDADDLNAVYITCSIKKTKEK